MAMLNSYDIVKMTEEVLLTTLKENVIDNIVDRMVNEFKEKSYEEVKAEVEKLVISGVETIRDLAELRDEVKVYCEWNE